MSADGTAKPDAAMKRPWHRLHSGTLVVALGCAVAITVCQKREESTGPNSQAMSFLGWPFAYAHRPDIFLTQYRYSPSVNMWGLAYNLVVCTLLLVATVVCSERVIRRLARWQHSVSGLLVFLIVVSATLSLLRLEAYYLHHRVYSFDAPDVPATPILLFRWPLYLSVPIILATACTVYTAGWLATRLAGWCVRSLARRFRRPSEGEVRA